MKIKGIDNMSYATLYNEIEAGGHFIIYPYCISLLVVTLKRNSSVYFVKHDMSNFGNGLPYILISLFLGWWGIPWGPIYTLQTMYKNFTGGIDVTEEVLGQLINTSTQPRSS